MKVNLFMVAILILLILKVFTQLPKLDYNGTSIDLLGSNSSIDYTIYQRTSFNITVTLKKVITKNNENNITSKNYLNINLTTR